MVLGIKPNIMFTNNVIYVEPWRSRNGPQAWFVSGVKPVEIL